MSTEADAKHFSSLGVVLCGVFFLTGIAAERAQGTAEAKVSLEEVVRRVETNEAKLSLIKMDFRTDFRSEGKVPDYSHRHPGSSGKRSLVHHRETQWAQDGVRQRFVERRFEEHRLRHTTINVVDGETLRISSLPEMKRGGIRDASRYNRWQVNFACCLFYRPFYSPRGGAPLLSEMLTSADVLSDLSVQELNGRDVFVVDIQAGRLSYRRLSVDRERGLLVQADLYLGHPAREKAKLLQRLESTKIHQTENGAWVPTEGRETSYGDGYKRFIDVQVDVNSISVDRADIPDSLFHLEFPEHTIVTKMDWRSGIHHCGRIDQSVADR